MIVGIVGTGLIGASIGLGLRHRGHSVRGWDVDPGELAQAVDHGAVEPAADASVLLTECDVVILAAPPRAIVERLRSMPPTNTLVMDVAGVKGEIVDAASHLPRFVGTHPMAGRETAGAAHASAALFRGAAWVVTTDGARPEDLEVTETLIGELGARPVRLTAAEHDEAVATISHLPQLVASSLVHEASAHPFALDLAAGGFRDLTRVAASDPGPWSQLLSTNSTSVVKLLRSFASRLEQTAAELESAGADKGLASMLAEARAVRRGLAPPVVAVQVALTDRPGELALVGQALSASKVDVRDLQLRHGRHGGGGILTLSVRPGEAAALRHALEEVALEVLEE